MSNGEMKRIVVLPYRQIVVGVSIVLALFLFLQSFTYLSNIYIPILVSYFFAFLLNPVVSHLEKRGLGRVGPSIFLLSIFFALLGLILILMIPRLITQVHELVDQLPQIISTVSSFLSPYSMR